MKHKNASIGRRAPLLIAFVCILIPVGVIAALTWLNTPTTPDTTQMLAELHETAESVCKEQADSSACIMLTPPPTATLTVPAVLDASGNEIDSWALTTTRIVAEITQTAAAELTVTPLPPLTRTQQAYNAAHNDEFELTATQIVAEITQTADAAMTMTEMTWSDPPSTSTPEPFELTATQIVAEITQTVDAAATMTSQCQCTQPTPDAFELTATQIVAEITQTVVAAAPRTTPISVVDKEILYQRWKSELETAAGFEHPVLDTLAHGMTQAWIAYAQTDAYTPLPADPIITRPESDRVTYHGADYIALLAPVNTFSYFAFPAEQLLIFRQVDGQTGLMDNPLQQEYRLKKHFNMPAQMAYPGGFGDRNHNELPDLLIYTDSTSPDTPGLFMLELQDDGRFVDISPRTTLAYPRELVDVDNDDVPELKGIACVNAPMLPNNCGVTQYFAWDGRAYVDISGTLDEPTYYPDITRFWQSISWVDGCLLPQKSMYAALSAYIARGQFDQGWSKIQARLEWDKCSANVRTAHQAEMDTLLSWVEEQRGS